LIVHVDDADSGAATERARGCAGDAAAASTPASLEYGDRAVHNPIAAGEGAGGGDAERQGSNMAAPERWLDAPAAAADDDDSPSDAGAVQATVVMIKLEGGGPNFGDNGGGGAVSPPPPSTSGTQTLPESGAPPEERRQILELSMGPWRETEAERRRKGSLTPEGKIEQPQALDRTAAFQSWDERVLEPALAPPSGLNTLTPLLATGPAWLGMATAPSAAVPVTGDVNMDEMILGDGSGEEHKASPPSRQAREVATA
ncbi:hypothetical protein Vafri_11892, partial [Volvox africanus]